MLSVFRNLLYVIRNFKTAMILNIIGLSVAFAAFIIIMMQVDYDLNFDNFHEDADKIYRVENNKFFGEKITVFSFPMANLLLKSPQIETGTIQNFSPYPQLFSVDNDGVKSEYIEQFLSTDTAFVRMFDFVFTEGAAEALNKPDNVVIPQSLAKKNI